MKDDIVRTKNNYDRKFQHLTENFYVIRAALRFYSVKKGKTFTASDMSEDFPVSIPVAGSCLGLLEELDVVGSRTNSSSPDRYMPRQTDMERLKEVQTVLEDNYEIQGFLPE